MRRIVKGTEPEELRRWKDQNAASPQLLRYPNLGGAQTIAIRQQMLAEQGYLCAYTMQRIQSVNDCHIEHIVPRSQPPESHNRDLDYTNMLACFPGRLACSPGIDPPPGWNPREPYGAQHKGGTFINEYNFISPLRDDVESRFQYSADGRVSFNANDTPAMRSIEILKLNHDILTELRRAAIDERIFEAPMSIADAEKLAVSIATPDSTGMLSPFCIAISQVSMWYANTVRNNSQPSTPFD
jgi:uncharacterized protein (TIGR02646 family)